MLPCGFDSYPWSRCNILKSLLTCCLGVSMKVAESRLMHVPETTRTNRYEVGSPDTSENIVYVRHEYICSLDLLHCRDPSGSDVGRASCRSLKAAVHQSPSYQR